MAITIDKSQYKNFSCKVGKKNKITKVKGNEYIIDASTTTNYNEGNKDCAFSSLAVSQNNYNGTSWNDYTCLYLVFFNAHYYLRREVLTQSGSYTFTVTGKTITNIDKMVATYTLYYNKYKTTSQLITSSNYSNSKSSSIFSQIKSNHNRPSSSYNKNTQTYSEYDETTDSSINIGVASGYYDNLNGSWIGYNYPEGHPANYCKVVFVSKTKNQDGVNYDYTFRVNWCFTKSGGWNRVAISSFSGGVNASENNYIEVVKVQIAISGFTVSKEEVSTEHCPSGDDRYVLELQTNELMQQSATNVSVGANQHVISFQDVANEIINAYKDNRLIATFDLINNRKYTIDGETRYLRAGDRIKIKGIDGKFISSQGNGDTGNEFEIIKANSKYNGFYYKEITAKEILST